MTLEQYFNLIIKSPTEKEPTMLEKIKSFVLDLLTKPDPNIVTEITDKTSGDPEIKDKLVIEMYTDGYYNIEEGERIPPVHTVFYSNMDATWVSLVDTFIEELEKHFGYSIKEQVYYSVSFPENDPQLSAYGRKINDERFQLLLLAHPELYEDGEV